MPSSVSRQLNLKPYTYCFYLVILTPFSLAGPRSDKLVKEMKLAKFQAAYGEDGKREKLSSLPPLTLTPEGRKDEFAPAVDSSSLIGAEEVFEAFANVDWNADYAQINPSADAASAGGNKTQE